MNLNRIKDKQNMNNDNKDIEINDQLDQLLLDQVEKELFETYMKYKTNSSKGI